MKKSLIALAVAGAVAAPAALADTANVTIYGQARFSVDWVDTGADVENDKDIVTGRDNVSRLGFKGSEDLGNGNSAIWQIEYALNASGDYNPYSSDNTDTWRNTFVGLSGKGWGTMMLGRHDTPYKLATGKLDIFADTAADYNAIIGNVAGVNVADLRADAMVAYISPNWSGFHFAVAYVDGVGLGTDLEAEAWSMMGMYENGPLFLSGAWEHVETDNATLPSTPFGTIENPETDAYKLGAGYKFGNFQVGFIYEKIEADSDDPIIEDFSRDAWYLNGQYTMGNIVLKGFWGMADEIEDIDDSGTDFYGLGADYNLSKRTKLFALYTSVDNDDNGSYRTSSTGYAFAEGESQDVFSVGMVHTF